MVLLLLVLLADDNIDDINSINNGVMEGQWYVVCLAMKYEGAAMTYDILLWWPT